MDRAGRGVGVVVVALGVGVVGVSLPLWSVPDLPLGVTAVALRGAPVLLRQAGRVGCHCLHCWRTGSGGGVGVVVLGVLTHSLGTTLQPTKQCGSSSSTNRFINLSSFAACERKSDPPFSPRPSPYPNCSFSLAPAKSVTNITTSPHHNPLLAKICFRITYCSQQLY